MNPEELRIGNYIQNNSKDVKVQSISVEEIGVCNTEAAFSDLKKTSAHESKGIPLTDAWLFNLGFEDIGGDEYERTFVYKDNRRIKIKVLQADQIHLEIDNNYWGQIKTVH
ncbi:MAG: hypothetical protein EOP48_24805, partial [Sphingobacteriales bacterium]